MSDGPDGGRRDRDLIGLHRLADFPGQGRVPELYRLLMARECAKDQAPNVVRFPLWATRRPGERPPAPLGAAAAEGRNVVVFGYQARHVFRQRKTR